MSGSKQVSDIFQTPFNSKGVRVKQQRNACLVIHAYSRDVGPFVQHVPPFIHPLSPLDTFLSKYILFMAKANKPLTPITKQEIPKTNVELL